MAQFLQGHELDAAARLRCKAAVLDATARCDMQAAMKITRLAADVDHTHRLAATVRVIGDVVGVLGREREVMPPLDVALLRFLRDTVRGDGVLCPVLAAKARQAVDDAAGAELAAGITAPEDVQQWRADVEGPLSTLDMAAVALEESLQGHGAATAAA